MLGIVGADGKRKPGRGNTHAERSRETLSQLCEELPDSPAQLINRAELLGEISSVMYGYVQFQRDREKLMSLMEDGDGQETAALLRLLEQKRWKDALRKAETCVDDRLRAMGYRCNHGPRWEREETG